MREIYELKDKIISELKKYASKPEMSASALETVDKLAHAAKNLEKIIEDEEGGDYSGHYGPMYYAGARGRGSNAMRDSRGRYSNEGGNYNNRAGYSRTGGEIVEELRELMHETDDPKMRQEIERTVARIESGRS